MTLENTPWRQPQRLLLATDLSARCDRALDRAVALAGQWQAQLSLVHAVECLLPCEGADGDVIPAGGRDLAWLHRRVRQELAEQGFGQLDIDCIEGEADDVVLARARAVGADLVVTGVARDQPFRQALVGDTALALARKATTDVLTVRKRGRMPYRRIVVAIDMSAGSAAALHAARAFFPAAQITVFHACTVPFAGMVGDREAYVQESCATATQEARAFLEHTLGQQTAAGITLDVAEGRPAHALACHAEAQDADLIVAGVTGSSALADVLLGSVATELLAVAPCDVLLIRPR